MRGWGLGLSKHYFADFLDPNFLFRGKRNHLCIEGLGDGGQAGVEFGFFDFVDFVRNDEDGVSVLLEGVVHV